jgi:predicted Fe-S protein YdhL (DUF1289 family)
VWGGMSEDERRELKRVLRRRQRRHPRTRAQTA